VMTQNVMFITPARVVCHSETDCSATSQPRD
jgi:hypothetical protein